jgi:hypothetical protein
MPIQSSLFEDYRVMSITEIKRAIDHLSPEERAELNQMLYGWENDAWDKQMQADAAAGKLDHLVQRAEAEAKAGKLKQFP